MNCIYNSAEIMIDRGMALEVNTHLFKKHNNITMSDLVYYSLEKVWWL